MTNTQQKTDWEVRFEKNCLDWIYKNKHGDPAIDLSAVKSFIRQTLSDQLERVENMKVLLHIDEGRTDNIGVEEEWGTGYNQAIDDVLNTLRKELTNATKHIE